MSAQEPVRGELLDALQTARRAIGIPHAATVSDQEIRARILVERARQPSPCSTASSARTRSLTCHSRWRTCAPGSPSTHQPATSPGGARGRVEAARQASHAECP